MMVDDENENLSFETESQKQFKTPQEKKRLSMAKDCRNSYGENDKSSRKNIPLRKRKQNRVFRKTTNQILQNVVNETETEKIEILEGDLRGVKKGDWRKNPDLPLKEFIERQLEWREKQAGKGKTALKKIREIIKNLEIQVKREADNRWLAKIKNLSEITAYGETPEKAVERVKYVARAAISNELGFDVRISIDGKFVKPTLEKGIS